MNTLIQSPEFASWFHGLRDRMGKAHIVNRIDRAEDGNFGDCAPVGEGISEMRIHCGPGYRIYFTRQAYVVYLLLIGGDKSTQPQDIARAKAMLSMLPKE